MSHQTSLLIVFVKNPQRGKVKTRLAESVGDRAALDIYGQLLNYTQHILHPLQIPVHVYFSDFIPKDGIWNDINIQKRKQNGKDLGMRMKNAFKNAFFDGFQKIVIIGSDCVELTTSILKDAFKKLEGHDIVIGPSRDGGYYLLGMVSFHEQLFEDKTWSTPRVFKQTIESIKELGLSYTLLPPLNDIDSGDDWEKVKDRFLGSRK